MDLRPELLPPRLPEQEWAELVSEVAYLDGMEAPDATARAAAFNRRWGSAITDDHFAQFYSSMDVEGMARLVLAARAEGIVGLTRDELVEVARRLLEVDDHVDHVDWYLALLAANVPHPAVSDLIFYPKSDHPSPEQVVDEALAYVPHVPMVP